MLKFFFQTNFIQAMTKKEKDQQEAIWELLSTEAAYISKLYVIKKVRICCIPGQFTAVMPLTSQEYNGHIPFDVWV